jgi:tRNA(Ile)-lysidine synthase
MPSPLALDRTHLRAGMRVALAVSGGADSVALLRAMVEAAPQIGLVLSVVHVHHGIRGAEADRDAEFVAALAEEHRLRFHLHQADTPAYARQHQETLEEAARHLRYACFGELLSANQNQGAADAVATAHTLDDQAETVLLKLLRGAWTEGLGGIHPTVAAGGSARGLILRPLLGVRRAEIEAWLRSLGQGWREDATNADTAFTRNRVRHELLPQLATFNPQIASQLAHLSALARDEETYWRQELDRLLPALLLPGRAVRGGGRAVSTHPEEGSLGIEVDRLRALVPAVRRRVLREAARRLGVSLNFDQVERLLAMLAADGLKSDGRKTAPRREQLTASLRAERTPRELRLILQPTPEIRPDAAEALSETARKSRLAPVEIPIPGELAVPEYGLHVRSTLHRLTSPADAAPAPAILRTPQPGDRVRLRYTAGKKPLKEVFTRLRFDASARPTWPLIAWQGEIVWMKDIPVEPDPSLPFALEITALPPSAVTPE